MKIRGRWSVVAVLMILIAVGWVGFMRGHTTNPVLDLSSHPIGDHSRCPVHRQDFTLETVSSWPGTFSPHATKEWRLRKEQGLKTYPCAVPFPPVVEDPWIKTVIRPYCASCRTAFQKWMLDPQS